MTVNLSPAYGTALYLMLGALAIFLLLFLLYLWRTGWGRNVPGEHFTLRPLRPYDAAREGLSRASETGRALHASPGTGAVRAGGVATASTLAGLTVVESMARASAITGAPVIATTNDAVAYALAENAVRRGYQRAGWSMEGESGGARMVTHEDSIAYVAGAAEVVSQQKTSHAVTVGQFGPEVLFLMEAQRRSGANQIAGSSDPQAAALMLLSADHTLVGEEIFASGAYLERRQSHIASLLAQDGLRWVVILVIIAGFIVANALGESPRVWFGPYP
ncbi:MAG: DUF6754 domain-containing protein [Chloroflexia bacterium]